MENSPPVVVQPETKAFSVGACSQWERPKLYLAPAACDHKGRGAGPAAAWSLEESRRGPSLSSPHVPSPLSSDTSFFFFFICTLLWSPGDELGLHQVTWSFAGSPFFENVGIVIGLEIVSLLGVCFLRIVSGIVRCVCLWW